MWNLKEIRKRTRLTVFTKGAKSYFTLILILFIFSFVGIIQSLAQSEINILDMKIGIGVLDLHTAKRILVYARNTRFVQAFPDYISQKLIMAFILNLITSYSWLINILSRNTEYLNRNIGEVLGIIMTLWTLYIIVVFFFGKTFSVGLNRAIMENRFKKNIQIRRLFAPYSNRRLPHVFKVMCTQQLVIFLWSLTIVGGIIKYYEYIYVPFLIAENPHLNWTQAKNLSKEMTNGYKFKLFLGRLSYIYLDILLVFVPFSDLFLLLPLKTTYYTETYFTLRKRAGIDNSKFIENAFNSNAYVDRVKAGEKPEDINPLFMLPNFSIRNSSFDKADKYKITDYIAMFFLFSFVGWLWEVGLHIVQADELVNRGIMYGPWLPIYGTGGVVIIALLNRYKSKKTKLFILTMLLCGVIEYTTSLIIECFANRSYWDYHNMAMNINGRVCLAGLIAFSIGGFLGIYILGPLIKNLMQRLGDKRAKIVCSALTVLFIIDLIVCIVIGPNTGKGVGKDYSMLIMNLLS